MELQVCHPTALLHTSASGGTVKGVYQLAVMLS
jgi:hypothetical protein